MNHGRQLRLFLPDGSASGPRYYELVNWTGQALRIPVSRLKTLTSGDWPEMQKPGIYLVLGKTEEGADRLYIGESDDVAKRVQSHPDGLDFEVTEILLFTSKDENLTKTHIAWLEHALIAKAKASKRITITNTQTPSSKPLSKPEQATMLEFLSNLLLVAQTAGFTFFTTATHMPNSTEKQPADKEETDTLYLKRKHGTASARRTDEGFTVLKGSPVKKDKNNGINKGYAALRDELISKEVLIPSTDGSHYLFAIDYAFNSSSAAAAVIVGNNTSGPANWRDHVGTALKDL